MHNSMASPFEELKKDFETTEQEQKALERLRDKRDWQLLKTMVERYVLKLNYNLVAGTELERGARADQLEKLSGFVYYWNKLVTRVDYAEHQPEENK